MGVNKFVYDGEVKFDLTGDDVTAADVKYGVKFHTRAGDQATGTNRNDSNTQDATAVASNILLNRTAYVKGSKVTGTMSNRGAWEGEITESDWNEEGYWSKTIPVGFHDGSGSVSLPQGQIKPENIKQNVTILGVTGTYSGDGVTLQSKTVTPTSSQQSIHADSGYDALSSVTVNAIPYAESQNEFGGLTVTIG